MEKDKVCKYNWRELVEPGYQGNPIRKGLFILGPERRVSQGRSGGMKGVEQCSEGRTRGETLRQACGPEGLTAW